MLNDIDIPPAWEQIDLAGLRGVILVIGSTDVGKSTFARYLYYRFRLAGFRTAFLDGDPGQSVLGPPASMTLGIENEAFVLDDIKAFIFEDEFKDHFHYIRSFVGSTTPRGHMLQVLVGAHRLTQAAFSAGAQVIIYDTSGLVDPVQGGLALKLSIIELLRPDAVFAIQQQKELEPIITPLRLSRRSRLIELAPSESIIRRSTLVRQSHRMKMFAEYFIGSQQSEIDRTRWAVIPAPRFFSNRLVAFEDVPGFALGLGILLEPRLSSKRISILTPLTSFDKVVVLKLGDLLVNPVSFEDHLL